MAGLRLKSWHRQHLTCPGPQAGRRLLFVGAVWLTAFVISAHAAGVRPPAPEKRLTFESLGAPALSQAMLAAGGSMLTVHFVDADHLLVTFSLRGLVPRIPGDPEDDQDRIVGAELVELGTGKVVARTRWHLHDHGRYLWSLAQGRFLLRAGDSLSTFAPLANLHAADAFQRTAFTHRGGVLDGIQVSADGRLVTVETHPPEKKRTVGVDINSLTTSDEPFPKPRTYIDFYRIEGTGSADANLKTVHAGVVLARGAVHLPVSADGYLIATGGKRGHWPVDFEAFSSKAIPVGAVDSNCPPDLELVSQAQWLAFTCRSVSTDSMTLAAYDFAKHEIWEEPMGSLTVRPVFASAPEAGRFAMSRTLPVAAAPQAGAPADLATGPAQEVRVYGTQTGDLLLKLNCLPTFRSAENFDLSADGMRLAIVRSGAVEIYRLPELTAGDREDLAEIKKLAPPPASGAISLRRMMETPRDPTPMGLREEEAATPSTPATDTASTTVPAARPADAPVAANHPRTNPVPVGDTAPDDEGSVKRKPPTLLNPGEKAEAGEKKPKNSE